MPRRVLITPSKIYGDKRLECLCRGRKARQNRGSGRKVAVAEVCRNNGRACHSISPDPRLRVSASIPAMNILATLRERFASALAALGVEASELPAMTALVLPAQGAKFGDYQANCAMPLGKRLGKPPREIATQLVATLDIADFCEPAEIAGPGFINLRIRDEWLAKQLASISSYPERLGVAIA